MLQMGLKQILDKRNANKNILSSFGRPVSHASTSVNVNATSIINLCAIPSFSFLV